MATTVHAFVEAYEVNLAEDALDENDVFTVSLASKFWRNVDGTVSYNAASVTVSYNAAALIATIDDAITDAIVDYADTAWGWTLPRTNCIFPQLRRGPVI